MYYGQCITCSVKYSGCISCNDTQCLQCTQNQQLLLINGSCKACADIYVNCRLCNNTSCIECDQNQKYAVS